MIKIIDLDNLSCPVAICDCCGKRIDNVPEGNYEWDDEGVIYTVHKRCSVKNNRDWEDLSFLIPRLKHNLNMSDQNEQLAKKDMKMLNEIF